MGYKLKEETDFPRFDPIAVNIVQTLKLPLVVVDEDLIIITANKAFCAILQTDLSSITNRKITEISGKVFNKQELESTIERTISEVTEIKDFKIEITLQNNVALHLVLTFQLLDQQMDKKKLLLLSIEDISKIRNREEKLQNRVSEQRLEIQEIHHRIKNNLFMISTILKLQAERTYSDEIKMALKDSSSRVNAISIIHQTLFEAEVDNKVLLNRMIEKLLSAIRWIYPEFSKINYSSEISEIWLETSQATTVGVILTEILSNVCRHAYDDFDNAELIITCNEMGNTIFFKIKDNGRGIKSSVDPANAENFGFRLIHEMVSNQLKGKVLISGNNGTEIKFSFRKNPDESVLQDISN